MLFGMKAVCIKFFFSSVLILAGSGVIVHSKGLLVLSDSGVSRSPAWKFDNGRDRDNRLQSLYDSINEMKEVELDKRIATTIRFDPASITQFLLSVYVLANHLIGPILPENFRPRIRLQNLLSEVVLHVIEIFLRLQIPAELTNQYGIFTENDILTDARADMMRIVGTREGQQIAYSLICILNGSPTGCVLPLIIRDFPLYLKFLGVSMLLCSPNFGGNGKLFSFFDSLYRLREEGGDSSADTDSKNAEGSEATAGRHGEESTSPFELSAKNSRVVVDLVSESVSMIFETYILTNSVINLPSGRKEKLNLFMVVKYILCALLTFQYVSIRGKAFGNYFSSVFQNTALLVTVQSAVKTRMLDLSKLSPAAFINSLLRKVEKSKTKNSKKKSFSTSAGRHKKKIKRRETPREEDSITA
jgi:hypothetical protein